MMLADSLGRRGEPVDDARAAPQAKKMRVAMVVAGFPMLSETFVINQAVGLIDMGHDLDIYALMPHRASDTAPHADVVRYRLVERARYPSARPRDGWRFVSASLRALLQLSLRRPRALRPLLDAWTYRRHAVAMRLVQHAAALGPGERYDVIHCQFGDIGLATLALLDAGVLEGALVVSFRGWDISSFVRARGRGVYRRLFARADGCFTNCAYFQHRLLALGCPADKLEVLYSGIDAARFPMKRHDYAADRPLRLITVGRLVGKKGIEDALHAVALLGQRGVQAHYTLIGDGPLGEKLRALARDLDIASQVTFAGAANQRSVIDALLEADLFLGPSVRSQLGDEDAPINTLKEAMAIGLPVVATRHGGIPELVVDGESGLLVPERDPAAIAAAVQRLIAQCADWPEMGRAGRRQVETRFDLHASNLQLAALYAKSMARRRALTSSP